MNFKCRREIKEKIAHSLPKSSQYRHGCNLVQERVIITVRSDKNGKQKNCNIFDLLIKLLVIII